MKTKKTKRDNTNDESNM